jgi:flavin reductase (DIM6/NTAB) family NADH-FMN oxidoreductase RutF
VTALDETSEVPAAEFREAMGHFATGVTVITSVGEDGRPVGTTANAVTSLSLDPPLLLVCFDLGSSTLQAIRGHGAFVVNVLGHRQRHLSVNFARRGLAAAWDGVRHRRGPTGSPRLDGVLAAVECTVEHALPGGDHEIIIGRVRHVETNGEGAAPLLFWRGRYTSIEGQLQGLPARCHGTLTFGFPMQVSVGGADAAGALPTSGSVPASAYWVSWVAARAVPAA